MSVLKLLKRRIQTIKSTQQMTAAMKLVASSHFKKAESTLEQAAHYTTAFNTALQLILHDFDFKKSDHFYVKPRFSSKEFLLIIVSGSRGLCGGYNAQIARKANRVIADLLAEGFQVKIMTYGSKARAGLRPSYRTLIQTEFTEKDARSWDAFSHQVESLLQKIEPKPMRMGVIYSSSQTVMSCKVVYHSLLPYKRNILEHSRRYREKKIRVLKEGQTLFCIEPKGEKFLNELWKEHLKAQLYFALCEGSASEHSMRMISMDHATKNAKDMLGRLEILYNKTRQASITKELLEIIAGTESI